VKIKKILFILLFCNYLVSGTINVAVAANVSYAIDELVKVFEKKYPDTKVKITLGSSGKLTAQIKNGAPYDVFVSANMDYPNFLYENKLAISKPVVYAKGSLALLSNRQRSFKHGLGVLQSKLVKRVAIANPKTAPYGKAAFEALANAKILYEIKNKFIYAESISQAVSYTTMAADLGIVAKSSLYSKKMQKYKQNVHWIEIDKNLYTPIAQGVVLLKQAKGKMQAKAFYNFILNKEAKDILQRYGYR
jgi:molybdate transport system substrate-binding protein